MLELQGRSQEYASGAVFGFAPSYKCREKFKSRMSSPRRSSWQMRCPHVEKCNVEPDAWVGVAVCDELRSGRARPGPGKSRRRQEPFADLCRNLHSLSQEPAGPDENRQRQFLARLSASALYDQ